MALYTGGGAGGSLPVYRPPTATVPRPPTAPSILAGAQQAAALAARMRLQQQQAIARYNQQKAEAKRRAQRAAVLRQQAQARTGTAAAGAAGTTLAQLLKGVELQQKQQALTGNPYLPVIMRQPDLNVLIGGPQVAGGGLVGRGGFMDFPQRLLRTQLAGGSILEWMQMLTGQDAREYTRPELPGPTTLPPSRTSGGGGYGGGWYSGGGGYGGGYSSGGGGAGTEEEQRAPLWIPPRIIWRL